MAWEMERELKFKWAVVGMAILLWVALMFGPRINYYFLYTNAPTKAQDLHEAYKALLNRW